MPISRELLNEIEMNPTRTGSASRWSCTGSTIQTAKIEPAKRLKHYKPTSKWATVALRELA
jgi:hypothetical protein